MDIWIILQKIILNQIDQESRHKIVITLETKLIEDLNFDSVQLMMLFEEMEKEFGVDFTDLEDFQDKFNLCRSLLEGVEQLLRNK